MGSPSSNADGESLRSFFERYAELSLGNESESLAELYAATFIVGGPTGSQAFANDERLREWLREVRDFNRQHGMRSLAVMAIQEMSLSAIHRLATVRWGARFTKTGERIIEFEISYLLHQADGRWQILAYVSQRDQAEEMRALGLL